MVTFLLLETLQAKRRKKKHRMKERGKVKRERETGAILLLGRIFFSFGDRHGL
jgi:hypothetical protein